MLRKTVSVLLALALAILAVPAFELPAKADNMPYYIEVDITNQIVTIYQNGTRNIVHQCLCSTGAKDSTPTGTFTLPPKETHTERTEWYYFGMWDIYAKYATRIFKGVMFHSLLYESPYSTAPTVKSIVEYGEPASHGCIRLRWQDAEFIAKNCLPGTKVKIYKSRNRDEEIRELLFQSSYAGETGQTYSQYLGIPDEEGVMGRFSTGEDVVNLQMRLRDLGLFADAINGVYRGSTVTAVRQAQELLGMERTGVATLEFQAAIYASDAPSAMNVTLTEGMSGPAVRTMQQNLAALQIYRGDVDSVYDVDVVEAVKVFQSAYGYTEDGVATPEVQKAIAYEAGRLHALFSLADTFEFEHVSEEVYFGTVDVDVGIRMREQPTTESHSITTLRKDETVIVLEPGNPWSKVQRGNNVGYVMNAYMKYYSQVVSTLYYRNQEGDVVYTIGYTAQDYFNGAARPAETFAAYLAGDGSLTDFENVGTYATVRTENPDLKLNLREAPNTDSTVLAKLDDGTRLKVLIQSQEWSMVEYEGVNGYLLNQYLEFWTGPQDALESGYEPPEAEESAPEQEQVEENYSVEYAVVSCDTAKEAQVYAEDSPDAQVLGKLPNGASLDVLKTSDGWCLISYQGHRGYMREVDLKFVVQNFYV